MSCKFLSLRKRGSFHASRDPQQIACQVPRGPIPLNRLSAHRAPQAESDARTLGACVRLEPSRANDQRIRFRLHSLVYCRLVLPQYRSHLLTRARADTTSDDPILHRSMVLISLPRNVFIEDTLTRLTKHTRHRESMYTVQEPGTNAIVDMTGPYQPYPRDKTSQLPSERRRGSPRRCVFLTSVR